MNRTYILKSKNRPVLKFDIMAGASEKDPNYYSIGNVIPYYENLHLWPHGLPMFENGEEWNYLFCKWLQKRRAVYERPNVGCLLECSTDVFSPYNFLEINLGMSFRDTYWIMPVGENYRWHDWSPYRNKLDEEFSKLAISVSPYRHKKPEHKLRITCEPTTAGTMRKCWINNEDGIYLRKGFWHQVADNRVPPVWEFYAAQVAQALDVAHVPHCLIFYRNDDGRTETLCECKCFTSEKIGYVPAIAKLDDFFIKETGDRWDRKNKGDLYKADVHKKLFAEIFGADFYSDMMLLDSIILHQNRHLGNWGYLTDNDSGEYIGPAPLTAHGYSMPVTVRDLDLLWDMVQDPNWAGAGKFLSFNAMAAFVQERHIPALERMKDFDFVQPEDPALGIRQDALDIIAEIVRLRCRKALEIAKNR